RHTRSKRDWSSDVCSSDLPEVRRLQAGRLHVFIDRLEDTAEAPSRALGAINPRHIGREAGGHGGKQLLIGREIVRGVDRLDGNKIGRASCRESVEEEVEVV